VRPLALRPLATLPPRRVSIFEDPGDERSWHVSQVFDGLMRYYDGREPAWYDSVIAPLAACERVVELGCGPSLALRALRARGVQSVLGLDRWPGLVDLGAEHDVPVLLHDLGLPIPFVPSSSVDGVFSHYVLDYMSPIGVRQTLREARRILRPGGKLLALVVAVGQGAGDRARTVRYTPELLAQILQDAGFERVEADLYGRNTLAEAVAGDPPALDVPTSISVTGESQLSAGFAAIAGKVTFEATGPGWRSSLELDLPGGRDGAHDFGVGGDLNPVSACARVVRVAEGVWELQVCGWTYGREPRAVATRLPAQPSQLSINCDASIEHASAWSPEPLPAGPPGVAYVPAGRTPPPERLSIQVTEPGDASASDRWESLLIVDLSEAGVDGPSKLESAWQSGQLHGVLVDAANLSADSPAICWACTRGAAVLLRCQTWHQGIAAVQALQITHLPPMLVLDPVLSDAGASSDGFADALAAATELDCLHVVASRATLERTSIPPGAERALLSATAPAADSPLALYAGENLRYLCERGWLLEVRARSGKSAAEVGRLPPLDVTA